MFYLKNAIEFSCFTISALISGMLYKSVIQVLRQSKQNIRGKKIANAFVFLWFSWISCVLPFLLVDLYACRLMDLSAIHNKAGRYMEPPHFFYEQATTTLLGEGGDYTYWSTSKQVASGLHSAATSLKHSYSFINSIILIVILRPFREPITRVHSKVKRLLGGEEASNE